jgi:zinc transporter ZupT
MAGEQPLIENDLKQSLIPNEDKEKKDESLSMTPIVLMLALTIHAMFEGIAVGLT